MPNIDTDYPDLRTLLANHDSQFALRARRLGVSSSGEHCRSGVGAKCKNGGLQGCTKAAAHWQRLASYVPLAGKPLGSNWQFSGPDFGIM